MEAKWLSYIGGVFVEMLLIFSFSYVDAQLHTAEFLATPIGPMASKLVPLLIIFFVIAIGAVMLVTAVREINK
jgi:hypothetical protein